MTGFIIYLTYYFDGINPAEFIKITDVQPTVFAVKGEKNIQEYEGEIYYTPRQNYCSYHYYLDEVPDFETIVKFLTSKVRVKEIGTKLSNSEISFNSRITIIGSLNLDNFTFAIDSNVLNLLNQLFMGEKLEVEFDNTYGQFNKMRNKIPIQNGQ